MVYGHTKPHPFSTLWYIYCFFNPPKIEFFHTPSILTNSKQPLWPFLLMTLTMQGPILLEKTRVHSLKLTFLPLKMDGWNTTLSTFLLGPGPFSGAFAVSFREGIHLSPPGIFQVKPRNYFSAKHVVRVHPQKLLQESWVKKTPEKHPWDEG